MKLFSNNLFLFTKYCVGYVYNATVHLSQVFWEIWASFLNLFRGVGIRRRCLRKSLRYSWKFPSTGSYTSCKHELHTSSQCTGNLTSLRQSDLANKKSRTVEGKCVNICKRSGILWQTWFFSPSSPPLRLAQVGRKMMLMDAIEKVFPQAVCKQEVCRRSFSEDFFSSARSMALQLGTISIRRRAERRWMVALSKVYTRGNYFGKLAIFSGSSSVAVDTALLVGDQMKNTWNIKDKWWRFVRYVVKYLILAKKILSLMA